MLAANAAETAIIPSKVVIKDLILLNITLIVGLTATAHVVYTFRPYSHNLLAITSPLSELV